MDALTGKVVVITGASSGLGRAAALEFAKAGCKLVLAARRADALEETAALCRRTAPETLVVETDVTDESAVQHLADRALDLTGKIDVWVNNAGVTLFGTLEDAPWEEHRRVIETNLFGAMLGARVVMPVFRYQGSGVLINVGSILSKVGQPYVPSYVISKFGLRGLTATLRTATADDPDIHVCSLLPYAFDTPHFESGANHIGLDPHAMPPMQEPEEVARALVDLVRHPRREQHVPRYATLGLAIHELFPEVVERAILHVVREWHFGYAKMPESSGNLFHSPQPEARVHGARPARTSLPRLFAWAAGHLLRAWLVPRRRLDTRPIGGIAPPLRPHSV
jgi:NAD(P)-dependent dehydrogenase (short-subunit alcohol dehydrogenase family)